MENITGAVQALGGGRFVLLYDGDRREGETDLVIPAQFVDGSAVRRMRRDGGGLICVTVPPGAWAALGLPYMDEVLSAAAREFPVLSGLRGSDIRYDTRSAFSLTVNHRDTFTGVTDNDRALTISALSGVIGKALEAGPDGAGALRAEFGRRFRSPGHVHLLNGARGLLSARRGHTELATALLEMAGLVPAAALCEMMGDGGALPPAEAAEYARRGGLVFIEGKEVVEACSGLRNVDCGLRNEDGGMRNESGNGVRGF